MAERAKLADVWSTVPRRSPWRWLAAALALIVAATHIPVTPEHLSAAPYIGWLFIALEIASLLLAVLLVIADYPLVWLATGVVPILAIAAYLLTRSVAVPEMSDDVGNWAEPLGMVALISEALLAVIALGPGSRSRPSARTGRRLVVPAAVVFLIGLAATAYATSINGG